MATWLGGLLLAALALGALEAAWRSRGEHPTVTDDDKLWAIQRGKVYGDNVVAIVGASRAQLDLSTDVLKSNLSGQEIVLLAVDGSSPAAVLLDLFDDREFKGTIIAEIEESSFERKYLEDMEPYVRRYHAGLSLDRTANTLISAALRERLTLMAAHLSFKELVVSGVRTGALPPLNYITTKADRTRQADYATHGTRGLAARRLRKIMRVYAKNPASRPEKWLAGMKRIEGGIKALHERGGRAVFVRFPTTGAYLAQDEHAYPRPVYWDAWATQTGAVTVHFEDVPALRGFKCPDGSHLDVRDSPAFTRALIAELHQRGLLLPK